jgi:ABC-type transport system involved in multi-copper enzyme maturation permease subunit
MIPTKNLLAMARLYWKTVVLSKRSLVAALLWVLPLIFFFIAAMRSDGFGEKQLELWKGFQFIGPLGFLVQFGGLFYGLAVISEEIENGTLPYLLVRPFTRGSIVLGRWAAATFVVFAAITLMNVLLLVVVRPASPVSAFLAAEAAALLGAMTYVTIFGLFATLFKKPLAPSLLFLIALDLGVSLIPMATRYITPKYHLLRLHAELVGISSNYSTLGHDYNELYDTEPIISFIVLAGITILGIVLTVKRFSRLQA